MSKKVSVVITVYNLEKLVGAAIDSVLAQTIQPLQIIVVDDCSTDNSAQVIKAYADAVTYHKMEQNSGVLRATIAGMKLAKGDIICFLDGDDVWLPEKMEETVKVYEADDAVALVTHHYSAIDVEGKPLDIFKTRQAKFSDIIQGAKSKEELSDTLQSLILKSHYVVSIGSAYSIALPYFNVQQFEQFCNSNFSDDVLRNTVQDLVIADYLIVTNPDKKVIAIDKKLFQYRVSGFNSSGQAGNLQSALKSLQRHKATTLITSTIVKLRPQFKKENRLQYYLNKEADYMIGLYQKKYGTAIVQFFKLSVHLWDAEKIFKELKRLVAVILLGPDKFFKLKSS
jgi:glycosyltransferase involved in cell wall biosynthesis